jgi:hypothetical protein
MPLTRRMGDVVAVLEPALVVLRNEFNLLNPKRDHTSDGWIGDAAHQAEVSDHNPDSRGIVHAIDTDKDGLEVNKIVAYLVSRCKAGAEKRLTYIIWNRTIWSATHGWTARKYTGVNPHTKHFHISGKAGTTYENDKKTWGIAALGKVVTKPSSVQSTAKAGTRVLKVGMTGKDVEFVERWLGVKVDGVFDAALKAKVVAYQKMRGVGADGIVGPITWRQMGVKFTG